MAEAGILRSAIKDGILSFLFIFIGSTAGATAIILGPYFGGEDSLNLYLLLSVIAVHLMVFGALTDAMGGASFNPTSNLANYWLGEGNESILAMGIKIPVQLAGSVLGARAIMEVMPETYKHTLGGPKIGDGVDLQTAIIAEILLTFAVNIVVLWCILAGPKSFALRSALLMGGVLSCIVIGAPYTGPAMNPTMAFAWAYLRNEHSNPEHFYVYWLAPVIGTIFAAIVFGTFIRPAKTTEKPVDIKVKSSKKLEKETSKPKEEVSSSKKKTS